MSSRLNRSSSTLAGTSSIRIQCVKRGSVTHGFLDGVDTHNLAIDSVLTL